MNLRKRYASLLLDLVLSRGDISTKCVLVKPIPVLRILSNIQRYRGPVGSDLSYSGRRVYLALD